ncbi:MAG: TauD/TfdA family dioxygenase, partial [Pseudomonadales bacterium]
DSDALLDEVWAFCTQPRFVYQHTWSVGDVMVWDNRCTIHRRDEFDDAQRRVMWRTQIRSGGVIS